MPEPKEPKLTKRQRAALEAEAARNTPPPSKGRFSRRFIIGAGLSALGVSAIAAATGPIATREVNKFLLAGELEKTRSASQRVYTGPNEKLKDVPFLDSTTLAEYVTALNDTNHPFLQKIARDVISLSKSTPHPELTKMAAAGTTSPLPILETNSKVSTVSNYFLHQNTHPGLLRSASGQSITVPPLESVEFAITIGRDRDFKKASPLSQSLFLAKEVLSLGLELSYERDFLRLTRELGIGIFTDHQGNPLDEDERQRLAGSLMHQQLTDPSTDTWKVIDGLPILMLSHVGTELSRIRPFPKTDNQIIGSFTNSAIILNKDRTLATEVDRFVKEWTASDRLLPSYELIKRSAEGKIISALRSLQ